MHIDKQAIPSKIDVPGAVARQHTGFGDATGYGTMGGEYISLGAGTDLAPLLEGLHDDACHAPHWGYVLSGALEITYTDGDAETCTTGQIFYWPPGHSVRAADDSEIVMFSPQAEHTAVFDHMLDKMASA